MFSDEGCTCFLGRPPCGRCENSPDPDADPVSIFAKMQASGWTPEKGASDFMRSANEAGAVVMSPELLRIMQLPRRAIDLQAVRDLTPLFRHTEYCAATTAETKCGGLCDPEQINADGSVGRPAALRPIQSASLWDMEIAGGAINPQGVGHGKELTTMLAASVFDAECTVIVTLASGRDQFFSDWERYGRHFEMPANVHFLSYHDLSDPKKNSKPDPTDPEGKRVLSLLDQIKPTLLVLNEAHKARHKTAACTKRILRYLKATPLCRLVATSGSLTNDSLKDYAHLSDYALGKGSPVPLTSKHRELGDWCRALDVPTGDVPPAPPGALLRLGTPAEIAEARERKEDPTELARRLFRRRLVETPGVVATEEGAISSGLYLHGRGRWPNDPDGLKVPEAVIAFLAELDRTWKIPGTDEEIDSPLEMARVARQAACGFYYRWDWSRAPWNGIKDAEWLEARRRWNKAVRHVLRYMARPGLDSPLLVFNATARGEISHIEIDDIAGAYRLGDAHKAWCAVKMRPRPPTVAVWLDPFVAVDAAQWAAEKGEGIIWYEHDALGRTIAEMCDVFLFESGTNDVLLTATAKTHPIVVASVAAHGTLKNLQPWHDNLYTSPMANGTAWEQGLGRTHRPGQRADEVYADVNMHSPALVSAMISAVADAKYQEATTGSRQKLLYANRSGILKDLW